MPIYFPRSRKSFLYPKPRKKLNSYAHLFQLFGSPLCHKQTIFQAKGKNVIRFILLLKQVAAVSFKSGTYSKWFFASTEQ